mgnify:CR=1 FL=1
MNQATPDLIVVGSGFGGSVCALRGAEAGLRVVVLERGPRLTSDLLENMALGRAAVFRDEETPGLLELHRLSGLLALTANGVGGGSNLYTAVTVRPRPEVFEAGWPAGVNWWRLQPLYDRVQSVICPSPVPIELGRMKAMTVLAERLNVARATLPLAMDWPAEPAELAVRPEISGVYAELVAWLRGGRAARKRTLQATYLAAAEKAGAAIRPLHEVTGLAAAPGGYRVFFRSFEAGAVLDSAISARRVVLAAGALGTTRLLLRCRDELRTLPALSKALGHGFSTNGDFGGLLVSPRLELPPDSGPPVTSWLDLWDRDRMYLMETGLVPFDFGGFSGLLNPARWFGGLRLSPARRATWSFGVMGFGDDRGVLTLNHRGRLAHQRQGTAGQGFLERSLMRLGELARAAEASLVAPPGIIARRLPITVHPLGGAAMADSPRDGVTDSRGRVHGYPGLYVADGSLLPAPTGVPPSMTIAALAEHVATALVGE